MSAAPTYHIVEIYLPLASNAGEPYGREVFDRIRDNLAERFGGVTFFSRSPAEGLWEEGGDGCKARDEIVVVEVMVEALDRTWWSQYRQSLERELGQDEVLIRAHAITKI